MAFGKTKKKKQKVEDDEPEDEEESSSKGKKAKKKQVEADEDDYVQANLGKTNAGRIGIYAPDNGRKSVGFRKFFKPSEASDEDDPWLATRQGWNLDFEKASDFIAKAFYWAKAHPLLKKHMKKAIAKHKPSKDDS